MKKPNLTALLLTLTLLLSLFAGCAKTETAKSTQEPTQNEATTEVHEETTEVKTAPAQEETAPDETSVPEPETNPEPTTDSETINADGTYTSPGGITYPLAENTFSMTQVYNPNATAVYDNGDYTLAYSYANLVEATGISITFDMLSEAAFSELLNLRIASGDYPDVFGRSCGTTYSSDMILAIEDEVLLDIAPLVEENAPDWYAILESDEDYKSGIYNTDLSLCKVAGRSLSVTTNGLLLRADWLEELGKSLPTNVDELTELLYAFHDAYDCRLTILVDSDLNCGVATYFNSMGNVNGVTFHQDAPNSGKLICGNAAQGYIDYLTWLRGLYADRLITEDFLSTSKNNGNLEACYLGGDSAVWQDDAKYSFSSVSDDPNWDAVAFTMSLKGNHFTDTEPSGGSVGLTIDFISATCHDPDECLKFLNYGFCQPGMDLIALGVEGVTYEIDEDGNPHYTDVITANPDGWNSEQAKYVYLTEPWMPTDQQMRVFEMSYTEPVKEAYEVWNNPMYDGCDDSMSIPTGYATTTEENEQINVWASDVTTIFQEASYKYIMGDIDLNGYYDAIERANAGGLTQITAIYQNMFDECASGQRELVTTGGMGGPGGPPM